jgi:hypothetical protein
VFFYIYIYPFIQKEVYRYNIMIFQLIMCRHLVTCSEVNFSIFIKSISNGEVDAWIKFLVTKTTELKHLSLECISNYRENSKKMCLKMKFINFATHMENFRVHIHQSWSTTLAQWIVGMHLRIVTTSKSLNQGGYTWMMLYRMGF